MATLFLLDVFKFLRQGACADAEAVAPVTEQVTILDCRNECANRPNVGYFAYRNQNDSNCACYSTEGQCSYDQGQYPTYNAYSIVRTGITI
jgi:hypothetical protein